MVLKAVNLLNYSSSRLKGEDNDPTPDHSLRGLEDDSCPSLFSGQVRTSVVEKEPACLDSGTQSDPTGGLRWRLFVRFEDTFGAREGPSVLVLRDTDPAVFVACQCGCVCDPNGLGDVTRLFRRSKNHVRLSWSVKSVLTVYESVKQLFSCREF